MATLSPTAKQRFFTSAGAPLVGGKLYSYSAGTTTPLATYTDATESTANANPIILDANGECDLWLGSGAYKLVLKDSSDVTQWTVDNINQASENTRSSPDLMENVGLSCAVNSNVLTVTLTNAAGSTPSGLSPVTVGFRSASLSSGVSSTLTVSSSMGMTVSSGSTLGHTSGTTEFIYVYLINYNGAAEMAVSSTLFPETALYTTVAEGGAGAADSRSSLYSIAARTNVPIRLIGRLTISEATAGLWAALPSQIQTGAVPQYYTTNLLTEGTWTPDPKFGGGNTGMVVSASGYYVKVGKLVTCYGQLTFTARGSSTGTMTIGGLPFTTTATTAYANGSSVVVNSVSGGSATNIMSGYVNASSTTATLVRTASGVGVSTVVQPGDFNDNSIFTFTIIYLSGS